MQMQVALKRVKANRSRLVAAWARDDTRIWAVKRRERTRHLIELGGLLAKAGFVELADDDRAVIFGMLVEAAGKLRGERAEQQRLLWRRRGQREFKRNAG
jgi:hypothetical protein